MHSVEAEWSEIHGTSIKLRFMKPMLFRVLRKLNQMRREYLIPRLISCKYLWDVKFENIYYTNKYSYGAARRSSKFGMSQPLHIVRPASGASKKEMKEIHVSG